MNRELVIAKIIEFQAGDRTAFETIYQESYAVVFRECMAILRDWNLVKKLTQDVFVTIFGRLKDLGNPEMYEEWMKSNCRNISVIECIKRSPDMKKDYLNEPVPQDDLLYMMDYLPDDFTKDPANYEMLDNVVTRVLKDSQYLPLYLHYNGLNDKQISILMGCSPEEVKARFNSAAYVIKSEIEQYAQTHPIQLFDPSPAPLVNFFKDKYGNMNPPMEPFHASWLIKAPPKFGTAPQVSPAATPAVPATAVPVPVKAVPPMAPMAATANARSPMPAEPPMSPVPARPQMSGMPPMTGMPARPPMAPMPGTAPMSGMPARPPMSGMPPRPAAPVMPAPAPMSAKEAKKAAKKAAKLAAKEAKKKQ